MVLLLALVSTACVGASIGQRRIAAEHGGWGIVAEIADDGKLDALFIRAPEGVQFDEDGAQYVVRTGPSSKGRASIRVLRVPPRE